MSKIINIIFTNFLLFIKFPIQNLKSHQLPKKQMRLAANVKIQNVWDYIVHVLKV